MMRKPVKTEEASKSWPNNKGIAFNDLLTFFFQNAGNKQRELMICGEVTMICLGEKKNQFHSSISG